MTTDNQPSRVEPDGSPREPAVKPADADVVFMPVPQISQCLDRIARLNAGDVILQFLDTMSKILRNVQKFPDLAQARTLNTQGQTYKRLIGGVLGAGTLLEAMGFEKQAPIAPHKLQLPAKVAGTRFLDAVLHAFRKAAQEHRAALEEAAGSQVDNSADANELLALAAAAAGSTVPPASEVTSSSSASLSMLEAMGFSRTAAERALRSAGGDVNEAAALLVSETESTVTPGKELVDEKKEDQARPEQEPANIEHIELPGLAPELPQHSVSEDARVAAKLAQELLLEEQQRRAALRMAEEASMDLIQKLGAGQVVADSKDAVPRRRDPDENDSEALARALQQMEEEDRLLREEEERAGFEAARRINQEMEDAKFAADMKRELDRQEQEQRKRQEEWKKAQDLKEEEVVAKLVEQEIADGPGYWSEPLPKGKKFQRIGLSEDSPLYKMVYARFKACGYKPIKIEYVQNHTTWELYRHQRTLTGMPEVWRFHGTPAQNVDGISESGILVSKDLSGRGTTIWSAEAALTSVGYSMKGPAADGSLYMFLCRVLSKTAGISTVTHSNHIYPEFLIHYEGRPANQPLPAPPVPVYYAPARQRPAVRPASAAAAKKPTKKERRRARKQAQVNKKR